MGCPKYTIVVRAMTAEQQGKSSKNVRKGEAGSGFQNGLRDGGESGNLIMDNRLRGWQISAEPFDACQMRSVRRQSSICCPLKTVCKTTDGKETDHGGKKSYNRGYCPGTRRIENHRVQSHVRQGPDRGGDAQKGAGICGSASLQPKRGGEGACAE